MPQINHRNYIDLIQDRAKYQVEEKRKQRLRDLEDLETIVNKCNCKQQPSMKFKTNHESEYGC